MTCALRAASAFFLAFSMLSFLLRFRLFGVAVGVQYVGQATHPSHAPQRPRTQPRAHHALFTSPMRRTTYSRGSLGLICFFTTAYLRVFLAFPIPPLGAAVGVLVVLSVICD